MNRISVITPSFRQVGKLKCCAASVADQAGAFEVEHLIQDGATGPDFDQWAASQTFAICDSREDSGMYEAINRGFRKATGNIIAWLNSDEQYLPDALAKVSAYFDANPDVDILFGDVVLTDESGRALAYRQATVPSLAHVRSCHLATFSAATFVRSKILGDGIYLDERWKIIADAVWIERILACGYEAGTLNAPLAAFSMLGTNLGQSPKLHQERREWESENGSTGGGQRDISRARHRMTKLLKGAYLRRRVSVPLYLDGSLVRSPQERMLGGKWSEARRAAGEGKLKRDGEFTGFHTNTPLPNAVLIPFCVAAAALVVFLDYRAKGVVLSPFLLSMLLLVVSFRCNSRQTAMVAVVFGTVVCWSLTNMPLYSFERFIVRFLSFAITSIMAVLWTMTRINGEEWARRSIAFIRHLPSPLLLLDSHGRIMMVNTICGTWPGLAEKDYLEKAIDIFLPRDFPPFDTWGMRPPDETFPISLGDPALDAIAAKVFVVGGGKRQIFGIQLSHPSHSADVSAPVPKVHTPHTMVSSPAPFIAAILNAYDHRNLGDRAIIETQIAWLETKHRNLRPLVFSAAWKENAEIFGTSVSYPLPLAQGGKWGVATPVIEGLRALAGIRKDTPWLAFLSADAYFLCGGGYFYSSPNKLGSRQLWLHIANSWLALRSGRTVMQFPQSWAPFHKRIDTWMARKLAEKLPSVSCRGKESLALMESWKLARKSMNTPDIVLALRALRPDLVRRQPQGDGRLAIAPVDFRFAISCDETTVTDYISKLADVGAGYARATGGGITVFTQVSVEARDDDHWVSERLYGELLRRGVDSRLLGKRPWEEYWNLMSRSSVFMGCRMHSCIFALVSGVPTAGISYQPKFQALFAELDMSDRCFDIRDFKPDKVVARLLDLATVEERSHVADAVDIAAERILADLGKSWEKNQPVARY